MVKPAISVIVPVYNIAAKVGKCIQSIQAQSFQDFELIVVDDGSRDGSGEICDKMADSRTKVIHQENAGVTRARAHGVEIALGEWVHFVDGDDVIPEGALQALVDACQGVGIVVGQVASMRPGDSDNILPPPSVKKHKKDKFISSESFIRRLLEYKISLYPFGRLFKRSLFDEHVFDLPREIRRGEDYIMNVRLGRKAERIRLIPDVVYHYIQYPESTLHTFKQNWRYETLFDLHLRKSFDAEELSAYQDSLTHAHIRQLLSGLADRGMNAEDPFFRQIIKEADGVTLSRHERWLIAFTKLPYPLRKTIYSALRQIKKSIIRR